MLRISLMRPGSPHPHKSPWQRESGGKTRRNVRSENLVVCFAYWILKFCTIEDRHAYKVSATAHCRDKRNNPNQIKKFKEKMREKQNVIYTNGAKVVLKRNEISLPEMGTSSGGSTASFAVIIFII